MVSLNSLPGISQSPLSQEELSRINAYWRAANYLSVGQIYLYANPLLREPLKLEHIKPRLLGHWGTTPGLNFIYVHFNRIIKKYDLNAIYIAGPEFPAMQRRKLQARSTKAVSLAIRSVMLAEPHSTTQICWCAA